MEQNNRHWTVFFIRHGETDYNARGIYQGSTDAALNRKGREQAREAGRLLADRRLEVILTSDLQRAVHTAEIVARKQEGPVEIHQEPGLREVDFGPWEGLPFEEVNRQFPEDLQAMMADPLHGGPRGMETLAELQKRAQAAWQKVCAEFYPRPLAVVAHGGTLRALVAHWLGMCFLDAWSSLALANGGVNMVRFGEGPPELEIPWGNPLGFGLPGVSQQEEFTLPGEN